jgi:hypothetical protein
MQTIDLINFDEVCEPKLSVPTYYMMEQELFETKRKLSLLEERMIRLEEKLGNLELEEKFDKIELEEKMNKLDQQKSHIIPIKLPSTISFSGTPHISYKWDFCDINCSSIKIDMFYMYFDNCKLFELIELVNIINVNYISFLKQFQNIKVLEIDLLNIPTITCFEPAKLHFENLICCNRKISMGQYGGNCYYKCVNFAKYILIIETLLNSYTNLDIIFKLPILNSTEYKPFEEMLMKSTNYKKLHMDFTHQRLQLPPPPSYLNETKEYCIRNNIEFTSNIGI